MFIKDVSIVISKIERLSLEIAFLFHKVYYADIIIMKLSLKTPTLYWNILLSIITIKAIKLPNVQNSSFLGVKLSGQPL